MTREEGAGLSSHCYSPPRMDISTMDDASAARLVPDNAESKNKSLAGIRPP